MTIGGNFPAEEIRKLARAESGAGEADEPLTNRIPLEAKERAERVGAR